MKRNDPTAPGALGAAVLGVLLACSHDSGVGGVGSSTGSTGVAGPTTDTPTTSAGDSSSGEASPTSAAAADTSTTSGASGTSDPGSTGVEPTTAADASTSEATNPGTTTGCDSDCPVRYRRVFVTSEVFSGGFNAGTAAKAFDTADARCQAAADAAGLPVIDGSQTRFRAWLSADGVAPHDRFMAEPDEELPYYLVDGMTRVAANWAQFASGALENPIHRDEHGDPVIKASHSQVWTGTLANGQAAEPDPMKGVTSCEDWTVDDKGHAAVCGSPFEQNGSWTEQSTCWCSLFLPFYCIEDADG